MLEEGWRSLIHFGFSRRARVALGSFSHRLRLQLPAFSAEPSPSPAPYFCQKRGG